MRLEARADIKKQGRTEPHLLRITTWKKYLDYELTEQNVRTALIIYATLGTQKIIREFFESESKTF